MGLYARERSGVGQALETRMMLSNAYVLSADFIDYAGRPPRARADAQLRGLGPLYRLYAASEGWVFLAAPGPRDFERLCAALGRQDLARDVRFADAEARARHAHALGDALERVFAQRSADDWEQSLGARGVGCVRADEGPHARYLFDAPWARELGLVGEAADSARGRYRRYGRALQFGRDMGPLGGAWRAGEHTRSILAEIGYSAGEVERLLDQGVVGEPAA
jgi:crotonobetainyl-CoA:carnitine CoA-transferase CaiB-like acyl-CoA transferase